MKLAIMQPYFFPYIGYFQLINVVDKFIIYDDVNYIKGGWINRNNMLLQGKPHLFQVHLQKASPYKLINETFLLEDKKSEQVILSKIIQNYKNAPYFSAAFSILERVLLGESKTISELNEKGIREVCSYLNIKTEIILSSSEFKYNQLKGEQRIIDMCLNQKATSYINAIGGVELYDKINFSNHGIQLNFIKTNAIEYKQFNNDFVPWLSIIDVMMFNSPDEIGLMLNNYVLL